MKFSEEINNKIVELFNDDKETAKNLLKGDYDAIVGLSINNNIGHDEVMDAISEELINQVSPEFKEKLVNLRTKAEKGKLYHQMVNEIQSMNIIESDSKQK